jgi:hypothetical protein
MRGDDHARWWCRAGLIHGVESHNRMDQEALSYRTCRSRQFDWLQQQEVTVACCKTGDDRYSNPINIECSANR